MGVEVAITILVGIREGINASGFKITIDEAALQAIIEEYVNRTDDHNYKYNVTEFIAKLGSTFVAIADYLLTRCDPDEEASKHASSRPTSSISKIILQMYQWLQRYIL